MGLCNNFNPIADVAIGVVDWSASLVVEGLQGYSFPCWRGRGILTISSYPSNVSMAMLYCIRKMPLVTIQLLYRDHHFSLFFCSQQRGWIHALYYACFSNSIALPQIRTLAHASLQQRAQADQASLLVYLNPSCVVLNTVAFHR